MTRIFQAFLVLVISISAIAKTTPQSNESVGDVNSISWWLGYATQQAATITDPNCRDEVYNSLGRAQALVGDVNGSIASISVIAKSSKRVYACIYAAQTFYKQGNISGYEKSMELGKVTALSERRIESQIFINGNLVIAYLDCNDVNGAQSYAESINNTFQNTSETQRAYQEIAAYHARNGNIKDADIILDNNIEASGKDTALLAISETCVRKGNLIVAEQMAQRLTRPEFKDRVYEKIGIALAESGNITKTRTMVDAISDLTRKSSVIAAIAKYQITTGDIELGKKNAQEVTYRDHKIAVYTLVAEKQADSGKIDSAIATIEMMTNIINSTPMAADKSKFGIFDDSVKRGAVNMIYLRAATTSAKNGDVENYNNYIEKAIDAVKQMNVASIWKGAIFIRIVETQLETGDIEGAKRTAKEINEERTLSSALYNIVEAQCKKGDIAGALITSHDITDTMNKSFAYKQLASTYVKQGKIAEAKKILLQLGNSSREAEAYRTVATVLVENGYAKELANWMINEMPSPQAKVFACIGAVNGIMKPEKLK